MPRKRYKRVLLKLSGEVFGGEKGIAVDLASQKLKM